MTDHETPPKAPQRVMLLGATGTIGRAAAQALIADGHRVVCFVRPGASGLPEGSVVRFGQVTDPASLRRDGFAGERFDVLVSCLASRSGAPADAWAIDHAAHLAALDEAKRAGVRHVVLLSAICVQKPKLAFQHAKLAFENALIESGLDHSIVRPTAYFKSLSGQIGRLAKGKPFLLFGNGELTATKPISDADLGRYLALCLSDPSLRGILPIGGPGPAFTPRQQGEWLFELMGTTPRFRHVPVALLDGIIALLSALGVLSPALRAKAELARIGRYYATESMLVWDAALGRYDAEATPSFGSETLREHHAAIIAGAPGQDLGAHRVF
ncbi:epimerase [Aestuariivirga litoralis]|uniref:Divinyl chlorophyllide a 8-vinyl-reductase, chloroplastic n=1 Tax=Aestuariivirga litoralis TaxID=2650924 RepID=A0A2W2AK16_9HYPH|nr:NAD(P)H-binding protein [Aestuariivirga litoralis]PZF75671.1 epimerase [Aestuariivirga litoralis]